MKFFIFITRYLQHFYRAISEAPYDSDALLTYIARQEKHHRTRSFQEEFRAFLEKYRVEYHERYVWD